MNIHAFNIINDYRNRAIAVFRLQKINFLTQELQEVNAQLRTVERELTENEERLRDVNNGLFTPSYHDLEKHPTADEAKTSLVERLVKQSESLNKEREETLKTVKEIEGKILLAATGEGKGNRYSRSEITRLANNLIEQDASSFSLEEISKTEDNN